MKKKNRRLNCYAVPVVVEQCVDQAHAQGKRTIWSTVNWRWKNSMPREFKMQIKWRFRLLFSFSCRSSNIFSLSKMRLFLEEKKEAQMQSYRILNWIWVWFDVCCAASVKLLQQQLRFRCCCCCCFCCRCRRLRRRLIGVYHRIGVDRNASTIHEEFFNWVNKLLR